MAVDYKYTALAWTAVVTVGAGIYLAYNKNGKKKIPSKQDIRKKLSGEDSADGAKEKAKKKRNERAQAPPRKDNTAIPTEATYQQRKPVDERSRDEEDLDNREFARRLQSAKSGVISNSQPQSSSRLKSVKQSRAATTQSNSMEDEFESSTTGAEGDDDLSAAESPSLGPTSMPVAQSGDVSDMLAPAAAGPSILRIIPSSLPPVAKKERQPAKEEIKETKKQRQNRKKNEAAKLEREEAEKVRKVLEEKQRRTAREAEGRAAKDGSAFMASQAPSKSMWTAKPSSTENETASKNKPTLLDTYEATENGAQNALTPTKSTGTKSGSDWEVVPDLTEEEQIRMLEADEQWNTVKMKKPKKKAGDSAEVSAAENAPALKTVTNVPSKPKKPATVKQTSSFSALKDEGASLKETEDSNVVGVWEADKGWTKDPVNSNQNGPNAGEWEVS